MNSRKPPFRADHVGSLLRPVALKEARHGYANGNISLTQLRDIENFCIKNAISRQQDIGLQVVTDGELRRAWWHWDFLQGLKGVVTTTAPGVQFKGVKAASILLKTGGKIQFDGHSMIDDFSFLKNNASVSSKVSIPSPSMIVPVTRNWRDVVSNDIYKDINEFHYDLAVAYQKAIHAFADAGCRYLQIDDCNFAILCDPSFQDQARARGDDPENLIRSFIALFNLAVADRPSDMTISMHSCRGNLRSKWVAEGAWDPVADRIFNELDVDAFFLEYDTDRAGGFEPLRLVPQAKSVVLGLVSSKAGALENKDSIKQRIDLATRFIDHDRLCLSPQCGFASSEEGNMLTEDEQWAKLALVVEVADEVWN